MSECCEAGSIYVVDLDMAQAGEPLDWSKLPPAASPKRGRDGELRKPIRVAVRDGEPAVPRSTGRTRTDSGFRVDSVYGPVYVGVVPTEGILDPAACFRVLERANQMNCAPIIWNHWERLPTDSARLANLMLGRAIECCAPIVLSDRDVIHEVVELANRVETPVRRTTGRFGEPVVDLGFAWGLDSAFKMVSKRLPAGMRGRALDRYRSLG